MSSRLTYRATSGWCCVYEKQNDQSLSRILVSSFFFFFFMWCVPNLTNCFFSCIFVSIIFATIIDIFSFERFLVWLLLGIIFPDTCSIS
ncbi:hypothetical protein ANTRET_LOCUS6659 [Anthophora retusa]